MEPIRKLNFEIPNHLDSLQDTREKIRNFLINSVFSDLEKNRILLSLDEAIANIIEHGYPDGNSGKIEIHLVLNEQGNWFQSSLMDDAVLFNPLKKATVDPNDFIEESRDGGMGIYNYLHLMKVEYETRVSGGNCLRLSYTKKANSERK